MLTRQLQPFDLTRWCGPINRPIDPLIRPLPWPVAWSPRSTRPGWWTVSLLSLTCTVTGDILSLFMNVTETCCIVPMLEAEAGYI